MPRETARAQHPQFRLFDRIDEPDGVMAGIMEQIVYQLVYNRNDDEPDGDLFLEFSCLEAPSSIIAIKTVLPSVTLDIKVGSIPHPDPRLPVAESKYCLWKFDGVHPSAALPPPAADIRKRVDHLAFYRYEPHENWAAAGRVARELGPERIPEILSSMVNPPPCRPGGPLLWLRCVQLAAAQVAAQVDRGWEGSARREALLSVLLGPQDWTTIAAIRALGAVGFIEKSLSPKIEEAFSQLYVSLPEKDECCWVHPLLDCWQALPHLGARQKKELQARDRELKEREQRKKLDFMAFVKTPVEKLIAISESGDQAAQTALAMRYDLGRSIARDTARALDLYNKAAEQRNPYACTILAAHCLDGRLVERNIERAVDLFKTAARSGVSTAMLCLGLCYQAGAGVDKDPEKGFELFLQGAKLGDRMCMRKVGECFETGRGVEPDSEESQYYLRRGRALEGIPARVESRLFSTTVDS